MVDRGRRFGWIILYIIITVGKETTGLVITQRRIGTFSYHPSK
jgi:hypothetical protein